MLVIVLCLIRWSFTTKLCVEVIVSIYVIQRNVFHFPPKCNVAYEMYKLLAL